MIFYLLYWAKVNRADWCGRDNLGSRTHLIYQGTIYRHASRW